MFLDSLKQAYFENKDRNPLLLRNTIKERIQFYVLDFIFNSVWGERLIMKGGTCLRFCFNLPRLSEDLDFDIENYKSFAIDGFTADLKSHFIKKLQYKQTGVKLANNKRTLYLKFPVLNDLGVPYTKGESNLLHVRIDLTVIPSVEYQTEVSIKSTADLSFLIKRYSLPDLFAGKICAILTRETLEGTIKTERFKGRDFYDLIWFLEKGISPDWQYIEKISSLSQKQALVKLDGKVKKVTPSLLKADLLPFFENTGFVEQFSQNFQRLYIQYKKLLE